MVSSSQMSIRQAALETLRQCGTSVLGKPGVFLGYMMDLADAEAPGMRVLERNCDDELLKIYSKAAGERTPEAVDEAATRAAWLLSTDRMIEEGVADRLSCELAFALAACLGLDCPERVRMVAVNGPAPRPRPDEAPRDASHERPGSSASSSASIWREGSATSGSSSAGSYRVEGSHGSGSAGSGRESRYVGSYASQPAQASQSFRSAGAASQSSQTSPVASRPATTAAPQPAKAAAPQPAPVAASPTYSSVPRERKRQAEEAGIGLKWYGFVKFLCIVLGAQQLFNVIAAYNNLSGSSVDGYSTLHSMIMTELFVGAVAFILYMLALGKLSGFRKGGPAAFLIALLIHGIAGACDFMIYGSTDLLILAFGVGAVVWTTTLVYFNVKARAELFSL